MGTSLTLFGNDGKAENALFYKTRAAFTQFSTGGSTCLCLFRSPKLTSSDHNRSLLMCRIKTLPFDYRRPAKLGKRVTFFSNENRPIRVFWIPRPAILISVSSCFCNTVPFEERVNSRRTANSCQMPFEFSVILTALHIPSAQLRH